MNWTRVSVRHFSFDLNIDESSQEDTGTHQTHDMQIHDTRLDHHCHSNDSAQTID